MAKTSKDLAALYRDKAEEAPTIAEAMGNGSSRSTVIEVAATWDRLADDEEKKKSTTNGPHYPARPGDT